MPCESPLPQCGLSQYAASPSQARIARPRDKDALGAASNYYIGIGRRP